MKFCSKCGNELIDEAVVCPGCGCAVGGRVMDNMALLNTLSQRLHTNGIIWLVIGILQVLGGLFFNWILLIVGILNIIFSVQYIRYSKTLLQNPRGIVKRFEPLTGAIITLVYNLVIGGVIGVVGSIYYLLAIRNYVMENKQTFACFDEQPI